MDVLMQPPRLESAGGVLNISLSLEYATMVPQDGLWISTRAINGIVPGPTLMLSPGDQLDVTFYNKCEQQDSAVHLHNNLSFPDESNLHFHGLHISGNLPSDDPSLVVGPGDKYEYHTTLPLEHMPGTHWYHPHRHGASALQVGGGAAGAIIVRDPPGSLPEPIASAPDMVMVINDIAVGALSDIAKSSGDMKFMASQAAIDLVEFRTVNGKLAPQIPAVAMGYMRWRLVNAAWRTADKLDLRVAGCEMQLIAKDGIYIRDLPRAIEKAEVPNGGRADVLVRCPLPGRNYAVTWGPNDLPLATVTTADDTVAPAMEIPAWSPETVPSYLEDLTTTMATPGCSCDTILGQNGGVNNKKLSKPPKDLHVIALGSVIERRITVSGKHPYHQHVYPFQLVTKRASSSSSSKTSAVASAYYLPGDWHDTVQEDWVVRYHPRRFLGNLFLHCHRLPHEDRGMMARSTVREGGSCICDPDTGI